MSGTQCNCRKIAETIEQIVAQVMHDHGLEPIIVTQDSKLSNLGMDLLDVIALIHRTEQVFQIFMPDDAITEQSRVGELTELVTDLLLEKSAREDRAHAVKAAWDDYPEDAA